VKRSNDPSRKGLAIVLLSAVAAICGCSGSGSSATGGTSAVAAGQMTSGGSNGSGNGETGTYTVSATVTGLTGQGLVLELNGGQDQAVSADGTVTFPSALTTGAPYTVTVSSQPAARREICGVTNGFGTIGQASVTNVAIDCSIVVGFLYQITFSNQLFSFGLSAGTGVPVPFGTPLATGTNPLALVTSPGGNFLYLGIPFYADGQGPGSISVYAVNPDTGILTAVSTVITSGLTLTRMVMSPGGGFLFVLGTPAPISVSGASLLTTYVVDPTTGALTPTGTPVTLDVGWAPTLAVTPDGKFLYVMTGNFGSSTPFSITVTSYAIDPATGTLTAGPALTWINSNVNAGASAAMAIDPSGRFLYLSSEQGDTVQAAATVLPYAINADTGALTPIGSGTPVTSEAGGMTVDPSGRYLYVLNSLNSDAANDTVLALAIDQSSGVVSPLGSPLEIAGRPGPMICDPSGRFVYVGTAGPPASSVAAFAISTAASTAGQLVPSGQSGTPGEPMGLAVVE